MIEETILKMIQYYGNDTKRINHSLKVFAYASSISNAENLPEPLLQTIKLAAIFHDIGIPEAEKKYNSSAGHLQEKEGPSVARKLLADTKIPNNILERVYFLIGNHHSYQKIDGIDFQILVEADFLVNINEDELSKKAIMASKQNIFKTATGIKMLKTMYLSES
ncbi:HD domain-containing protein [Marinifilum sp. RC60d5]|uniref:HD domain-containing protein n=1 Tax=Marinifilum sp. RC60d5 TaxID=3458414 RepID=UPI004036B6F9